MSMKSLAQSISVASSLGIYLVSRVIFSQTVVSNSKSFALISSPSFFTAKSMIKSRDGVWYFFSVKEMKYNRGDQQRRRTNSGFWKKTGKTMTVMRKRGNREKIGEKRVLVFKNRDGSKTDWVMHEYHATSLFPNQVIFQFQTFRVFCC